MQEALDLGRGLGRVKLLVQLTGGPRTLRELAEANGFDAPYATVIVDKLAARGLVERTPHPDDNRRKLVKLTAAGREAAALAQQIMAKPPAALTALPRGDLARLDQILARLVPGTADPPVLTMADHRDSCTGASRRRHTRKKSVRCLPRRPGPVRQRHFYGPDPSQFADLHLRRAAPPGHRGAHPRRLLER